MTKAIGDHPRRQGQPFRPGYRRRLRRHHRAVQGYCEPLRGLSAARHRASRLGFDDRLFLRRIRDDRPEGLPVLAVELHHLQLLVDAVVGRRGRDRNSRQQQIELDIVQAGGLLQHVLAGQLVAALLEHLNQQLRGDVAVDIEVRCLVAVGIIFLHEVEVALHAGIVFRRLTRGSLT